MKTGRRDDYGLKLFVVWILMLLSGPAAAAEPQPREGLAATSWQLVKFQSMDDAIGELFPADSRLYTMDLNRDGTVTMRLNCNRAHGSWSAEPGADMRSGRFSFGRLATTRALCHAPSMDEHIAANAQYIRSFLLRDGHLYLSLMADGGIYEWQPAGNTIPKATVYAAPENGGPRNWTVTLTSGRLNLRDKPSRDGRISDRYPAGTVLDNLGCMTSAARTWCDVQRLGGGKRGYVAAEFLRPTVSPDGSVATGPDDSALRAGRGQFDATGRVPCAQFRGQPTGSCPFGVSRAGSGYATVVMTQPDQRRRAIFFRNGRPIGADTSQADYGEFSAIREADLHVIRVGDERYEIPDAVIFGD